VTQTDAGSEGVMLAAVRDAIRDAFGLDQTGCQVTIDGRADPACGEWFVAVHAGSTTNSGRNGYLDELVGLSVTVTRRTGFSPVDRLGEEAVFDLLGYASRVKALIHMDYPLILSRANALLDGVGTTTNGFVEPLMFQTQQYEGPKGPSWFWSEGVDDGITGLAVTLAFGGARRLVHVDDDT
jgi:hypothetical protein